MKINTKKSSQMICKIVAVLLVCVSILSFSSCSANIDDKIQGTWSVEYEDYELTFDKGNWYDDESASGTYTVEDDRVYLKGYDSFDPVNVVFTYNKSDDSLNYGEYTLYRIERMAD